MRFDFYLIFAPIFLFSSCAGLGTADYRIRFPIEAECSIFSPTGELLWHYPKDVCHFRPDGSFVYGDDISTHFIGPDGNEIWAKPIQAHHIIGEAANGDFLVISSEWLPVQDHKFRKFFDYNPTINATISYKTLPPTWRTMLFRRDRLFRINQDGTIVASRSFPDSFFPQGNLVSYSGAAYARLRMEDSHFNSFYEIPSNTSSLPALNAGNFIVNDTHNRIIFVLDQKLERELWRLPYSAFGYFLAHDVKVLPNGNLLIFRNFDLTGPQQTSIDEVDPVSRRVVNRIISPDIHARYKGSAQPREGGALLYCMEESGKTIVRAVAASGKLLSILDLSSHFELPAQGAYERSDLASFLAKAARP